MATKSAAETTTLLASLSETSELEYPDALFVTNVFTSAVEPEISACNTSTMFELLSINTKSAAANVVPEASLSEISELVNVAALEIISLNSTTVPDKSAVSTDTFPCV